MSRCIHLFSGFPMLLSQLHEHKNANFVLGKPENGGSEGQKRTKTPILCSKCPKTGVSKAKKAQKPRFCARETNAGLRETESEALGLRVLKFRIVDGLFYHKGGRVFLFYDC